MRSNLPSTWTWALVSMVALSGACSPDVTETVFSGTWERGRGTFSRSVIAIWNEDGQYRFRVNRYQQDFHKLRCSREGACAIYEGNAPVYELVFEVTYDASEDALFVDCSGTPLDGMSTPVHWIERVSVSEEGDELLVRRIELNGQPRTDGFRRFEKISDDPFWRSTSP